MSDLQVNHLINNSELSKLDYKDNTLVYSKLTSFYKPILADGVSIKYVITGEEFYSLNNKRFSIKENECFISNQPLDGNALIDSKKDVHGVCMNITFKIIQDIESSLADCKFLEGDALYSDSILKGDIFEVFHLSKNNFSQKLQALSLAKNTHSLDYQNNNENLFFEIGEAFVLDQAPKLSYLTRINTAKPETKKEIVKRLCWAKEHLESYFFLDIQVKDLARIATMSEFHFSRMFKMVFRYSPYQYQIKLRMERAKQLVICKDRLIQDIAQEVGYSDIHVFSKAFKKYFGMFPTAFKK